jgi:hypothetical protein
LYALPYCAWRAVNIGPFAAFTASILLFAGVGFWTMKELCPAMAEGCSTVCRGCSLPVYFRRYDELGPRSCPDLHDGAGTLPLFVSVRGSRASASGQRLATGAAGGLLFGFMVFSNAQTPWFLVLAGGLAAVASAQH